MTTETHMEPEAIRRLAQRYADAVRTFDFATLDDLYGEHIRIWHNYDEVEQTKEQNVRSLSWVQRHTEAYRWDDIRVDVVDDGWVQQHVTRARQPELAVPTMMRVWCEGGKVTRVEHYLDSVRFAPLLPQPADATPDSA